MKSTKTLQEKIEVMQHYLNGGKITVDGNVWIFNVDPNFNWEVSDYSIYEEPKTKPNINWEHVNKKFKYMATDKNGDTFLYSELPYPSSNNYHWWYDCGETTDALYFTSFTPGTCNWKDSLVVRPE